MDAPPADTSLSRPSLRSLFHHRTFALVWTGAFISNIGNWMENSAQNWAVVEQSSPNQKAFLSEILNFADLGPALLLVLLAGVIADRVNNKRLLLILQALACLFGAGLAVAAYLHYASPWVVIAFTFAEGIIWALNGPPWMSVVPRLVPRNQLATAIAANSAQFNLARLIGPPIAGLVIARWGIKAAFTINAITFLPVFYALYKLPPDPIRHNRLKSRPLLSEIGTGLTIVRKHPGLRRLSLMLIAFMFLAAPLQGLLAVYVEQTLHGSPSLYGILLGAIGGGAFLGALTISRVPTYYPRHHLIPLAMSIAALGILAFTFTTNPYACFAILLFVGYFWMLSLNSSNAANQLLATDDNRNRVMSVMLLCNQGGAPLGHLFAAALTHLMSPPNVIRVMVSVLFVAALYFLMRREPAIDSMQRRSLPPIGIWNSIIEAITAQSHRAIPEPLREKLAQSPPNSSDITPHAT
jgi:predicted MFS family arabinose efflux permease